MEIEMEDLLEGQSTIIRGKEFNETKAYVQPFIDRFKSETDDFRIRVISPSQLSVSADGTVNQVYNRVLIEAVIPTAFDIADVVGMTYALDVRYPVVKFFKGVKDNLEGGQLYIDNTNNIVYGDITPDTPIDYSILDRLIAKEVKTNEWMESLKTKDFDASNDNVNYTLGQWVRFALNIERSTDYGTIKIGYADIVSGYKYLFETRDSNYYKGLGVHTDYLNIFSAMSDVIYNSKDIVNIPEKTVLLKQILSI